MARAKKLISKHDDPNSPIEFRNWKKELDEVIGTFPKGVECVAVGCSNLPSNRGAFLCKECGIKYYDFYKNIVSPTERSRAQYNWIAKNILAQDPE